MKPLQVRPLFVQNLSHRHLLSFLKRKNKNMAPIKTKPVKPDIKKKKVKKVKRKRLNDIAALAEVKEDLPPATRLSDEPAPKKPRWTNRQKVLVFASRGITYRHRHLMEDLKTLLPHSRSDSKMEKKDNLTVINEICEMKSCNKSIFFECKKKQDLYMWMSNVSEGPSVKFLVQNVYTLGELKLTGNCLKGSRPLLSFDPSFDLHPHYKLLKELLVQVLGTPNFHPKSKPFYDHVLTFAVLDNRIWFRNYQIITEDGSLAEVGPRFLLNPIKIFEGSFGGEVLWENPDYQSPNKQRLLVKKGQGSKYEKRIDAKLTREAGRLTDTAHEGRALDEIFKGDALEAALALEAEQEAESEMVTLDDDEEGDKKKKWKSKKPKNKKVKVAQNGVSKKKVEGKKGGKNKKKFRKSK